MLCQYISSFNLFVHTVGGRAEKADTEEEEERERPVVAGWLAGCYSDFRYRRRETCQRETIRIMYEPPGRPEPGRFESMSVSLPRE